MANQQQKQHGQQHGKTTRPESAEKAIAPEPTDRPYVPQNRPLRPVFRQTCVNPTCSRQHGLRGAILGQVNAPIPDCTNASTETNNRNERPLLGGLARTDYRRLGSGLTETNQQKRTNEQKYLPTAQKQHGAEQPQILAVGRPAGFWFSQTR